MPDPVDAKNDKVEGPLAGLRVLELGALIAGPFAGRLLADFGAEVIKAEPPIAGDPMREWGQVRYQGHGLWWPIQSRNKKLITLNLRDPRGQDLCRALLQHCDVLIENFRPGTLEAWNLGPESLLELNPRLIIARVSGYGQTGPLASRAGFASIGEAMGGLRYIAGYPDQPPPRAGVSLGDSLAGMFAFQGILMALHHRETHGGSGQVVDASILESCFAMLDSTVPEYAKLGVVREPGGSRIGTAVPSNVYLTEDDKYLAIAANADRVFERLCVAIDRPDLVEDPRYSSHWARAERADELDAIITAWTKHRTAAEADMLLNQAGVPAGPVYSIADIFADAHFEAREMLVSIDDDVLGEVVMPGLVPKLSETPGRVRHAGRWTVGHDNADVYGGLLGLDEGQRRELENAGTI